MPEIVIDVYTFFMCLLADMVEVVVGICVHVAVLCEGNSLL